jgi:hypothetical protein
VADVRVARPFWHDLPERLAYPLRREGLFVLLFFWVINFVPILNWLFALMYAAYLAHVLRETARFREQPPRYPDFDSVVGDLLFPLLRILGASLLAWGPLLLYRRFTDADAGRSPAIVGILLAAGVLYYPLAVTVSVTSRSFRAVVEFRALARIVTRIGPDYLAALAFVGALAAAGVAFQRFPGPRVIPDTFGRLVNLYLLFVGFHVLGRMVLQTRNRVDWDV